MKKRTIRKTLSEKVDTVIGVVSPRIAFRRKQYRFAYDVLDKTRTRRKRIGLGGTADKQLTSNALYSLREIHRELMRNNPLVKGLLKTERDGLIGSGVRMESRTADEGWNQAAEQLWKAEMLDRPCDVTGRFNFNQYLRIQYLSYRRDGDAATIFVDDDTLQGIEGDQIGTPYARVKPINYHITNGVAVSNKTKKVIGYYIGKPNRYGYIEANSYKKYKSDVVYLMFDPERYSQSRGEPALTSSIDYIDKLAKYFDAELVAACVNACFSMFISQKDSVEGPPDYTGGVSSTGKTTDDERLEKIGQGTIIYGDIGEDAKGIGQTRPGAMFDPFVLRTLTLIGRPLLMPLMLITLDYSGATFMNARIAYQQVRDSWSTEQNTVVKPLCSKTWIRKINSFIRRGLLPEREDQYLHEAVCRRWPYIDPFKEAMANEKDLENRLSTRKKIISERGDEPEEIEKQWQKEKETEPVESNNSNAA